MIEVDGISDEKVLEGTEQFAVNRFRKTKLGADMAIEEGKDVFAVGTLWGSC